MPTVHFRLRYSTSVYIIKFINETKILNKIKNVLNAFLLKKIMIKFAYVDKKVTVCKHELDLPRWCSW